MSYIKQTWVDGDIVTAEKMNHIEDGVEEGTLVVYLVEQVGENTFSIDKTFNEIANFIKSGNYNIILASSRNVLDGNVYQLCKVNYNGEEPARIVFSNVYGESYTEMVMMPNDQNTATRNTRRFTTTS